MVASSGTACVRRFSICMVRRTLSLLRAHATRRSIGRAFLRDTSAAELRPLPHELGCTRSSTRISAYVNAAAASRSGWLQPLPSVRRPRLPLSRFLLSPGHFLPHPILPRFHHHRKPLPYAAQPTPWATSATSEGRIFVFSSLFGRKVSRLRAMSLCRRLVQELGVDQAVQLRHVVHDDTIVMIRARDDCLRLSFVGKLSEEIAYCQSAPVTDAMLIETMRSEARIECEDPSDLGPTIANAIRTKPTSVTWVDGALLVTFSIEAEDSITFRLNRVASAPLELLDDLILQLGPPPSETLHQQPFIGPIVLRDDTFSTHSKVRRKLLPEAKRKR